MINTKTILSFSGLLAALIAIGTAAWAAMDYTQIRPVLLREFAQLEQSQQQTVQSLLLLRFQFLMQKLTYGGLTFAEQQELCQVALQLNYVGVPGCR